MSDSPADRLRKARIARGFPTAADAARAFGWEKVAYTHHENGTRGIRPPVAERYAKAFGIPVDDLLSIKLQRDPVEEVQVLARASIGVWRDARIDPTGSSATQLPIPIPLGEGGHLAMRFAVEICDDSVNKVMANGSYAICVAVHMDQLEHVPLYSFVLIERSRDGLIEHSVRRVTGREGMRFQLSTHSKNAKLMDVVTIPPQRDDEQVTIKGRVIGTYAPLLTDLE